MGESYTSRKWASRVVHDRFADISTQEACHHYSDTRSLDLDQMSKTAKGAYAH